MFVLQTFSNYVFVSCKNHWKTYYGLLPLRKVTWNLGVPGAFCVREMLSLFGWYFNCCPQGSLHYLSFRDLHLKQSTEYRSVPLMSSSDRDQLMTTYCLGNNSVWGITSAITLKPITCFGGVVSWTCHMICYLRKGFPDWKLCALENGSSSITAITRVSLSMKL